MGPGVEQRYRAVLAVERGEPKMVVAVQSSDRSSGVELFGNCGIFGRSRSKCYYYRAADRPETFSANGSHRAGHVPG